jgi:hypothetical protein
MTEPGVIYRVELHLSLDALPFVLPRTARRCSVGVVARKEQVHEPRFDAFAA